MAIINSYRTQRRKSRKQIKALRQQLRVKRIKEYALELNKNTPASELWFYDKFNKEQIERLHGIYKKGVFVDYTNQSFFDRFIPDVVNHGYQYIIEVDGDIHNNLKQAYKDFAKDNFYKKKHYRTFRVKAYDDASYTAFIEEFKGYIAEQNKSLSIFSKIKTSPELALRRGNTSISILTAAPPLKGYVSPEAVKPKTILRKANA